MWPRLKQAATDLELEFGERESTFNSRDACELACWAAEKNKAWPFHFAAYRAYFVDGKNLALTHTLQEIARKAGLPPWEVPHILSQRRYADQVDREWARCSERGVRAIPTIDNGERQMVGFQSHEALVEFFQG